MAAWKKYKLDGFEIGISPMESSPASILDMRRIETRHIGSEKFVIDKKTGRRILKLRDDDVVRLPMLLESEEVERLIEINDSEHYMRAGLMDTIKMVVNKVGHDAFVAGHAPGQSLNYLCDLRGVERAMKDLFFNPDFAVKTMTMGCLQSIEIGKAMIEAGVDGIYIGDAFASSTYISPAFYEKFAFPLHKKAVDAFHEFGIPVYLHICGNVNPILEKMAETGADAIEPLDPDGGVDLADAKKRIGKRVCLKGNLSTRLLLQGEEGEVKAAARECIGVAAPGGAFILGTGDDIPRDAPFRNVEAVATAAKDFGKYPQHE